MSSNLVLVGRKNNNPTHLYTLTTVNTRVDDGTLPKGRLVLRAQE